MTRSIGSVVLRPLTTADLPAIVGWFEDPETNRYLGGPQWPANMLANSERAVGRVFRGARRLASVHYLALADRAPVGYVDCGTFDRCTIYGGEGPDGPIILDTIEAVTGAVAFTISPARRREGLATQMIRALIGHPDMAAVELFEAGVEPENRASRRTLEAAGFRLRSPEPDCEEMLYYELSSPPSHPAPPQPRRRAPGRLRRGRHSRSRSARRDAAARGARAGEPPPQTLATRNPADPRQPKLPVPGEPPKTPS